jgi:hypothetical protein
MKMIHLTEKGEETYNNNDFEQGDHELEILAHLMQDPDMPVDEETLGRALIIDKDLLERILSRMERAGEIVRYSNRSSRDTIPTKALGFRTFGSRASGEKLICMD